MSDKIIFSTKVIVVCIALTILTFIFGMCTDSIKLTKTIKVSAYCPCEICCGKWADGQTASGYWIQPGDRFVAAPKHIPFGTELIVPGYNNNKPVEVKDRGGAITVERLEVYFDTHKQAKDWGVKYLAIRAIQGE